MGERRRGHIRWRAGAWRLVASAGTDPVTGKRRQVWRTVRAPNDQQGRREAEWKLAELLDELHHPGFAAWKAHVEKELERKYLDELAGIEARHMAALNRMAEQIKNVASASLDDAINPQGHFVYCLWGDDDSRPLYVGRSANVFARLGVHFADAGKRGAVRRVSLLRCPDVASMAATETDLIRAYRPPWNAIGLAS